MRRVAIAITLLLAFAAAAEAQQSVLEQALFQRLGAEVQANIQANAKIIELQQQLSAATEAIRKLTPKPGETAPDEKR